MTLDLEQAEEMDRVLLKWGTTYAASYTLEASEDGEDWETILKKEDGGGGTDRVVFEEPKTYRYLRISGVESSSRTDAQLVELEIYGSKTGSGVYEDKDALQTPGSDGTENGDEKEAAGIPWLSILLAGAGVVLVLAAVIVIAVVVRGRKKRKQENPAENEGGEE